MLCQIFFSFCSLPAVFILWSSDMQNMWAPHQAILHCHRKSHMAETSIIYLALQWPVLPLWKKNFYFPNFCFLIYKLGYYQLPISTTNRRVANVWKLYTKSHFFYHGRLKTGSYVVLLKYQKAFKITNQNLYYYLIVVEIEKYINFSCNIYIFLYI